VAIEVAGDRAVARIDQPGRGDHVQAHAHAEERVDGPLLEDAEPTADSDPPRVERRRLHETEGCQQRAGDNSFRALGHQPANLVALAHGNVSDPRG
jgi:hypothetical protein